MKKVSLSVLLILLWASGLAYALSDAPGVTFEGTFATRYLWRGYDRFDDKAAFQPSVTVDWYDTGFSTTFWASLPGSSGTDTVSTVNATEFDYILAYACTLFEGESYATKAKVNYIYYDFIDQPDSAADAQEIGAGLAWPDICPAGFVPHYYVGKIWPSRSNSALGGNYGGWIHIFGLSYDLTVAGILPDTEEQVITLMTDLVYNDGFGSATADHDWSHMTFGAKTDVPVGQMTFTPALYYQMSMDDSVNSEDELYALLSFSYSF